MTNIWNYQGAPCCDWLDRRKFELLKMELFLPNTHSFIHSYIPNLNYLAEFIFLIVYLCQIYFSPSKDYKDGNKTKTKEKNWKKTNKTKQNWSAKFPTYRRSYVHEPIFKTTYHDCYKISNIVQVSPPELIFVWFFLYVLLFVVQYVDLLV